MSKRITFSVIGVLFALSTTAQDQIPGPRYGAAVVNINDTAVFIFGGVASDRFKTNTPVPVNDLYQYDPSTLTFKRVVPSGDELSGMRNCSPIYDPNSKRIHFLGGLRTASDNALYAFYPHQKTVSKRIRQPFSEREGMSAADIGNNKWLLSGGKCFDGSVSGQVFVFNASTETFTQQADIPQGNTLYGHTSINDAQRHTAYIFGGNSGNGGNNFACYEYNTQTNSWNFGPSIRNYPQNEWSAYPLTGCTLAPNQIFIAGGQKYSLFKSASSVDISTKLYTITVDNGNLVGQLITDGLPPVMAGVAFYDKGSAEDPILYLFGGISSVTSSGDSVVSDNFYRYYQNTGILQQYDTIQKKWGGLISSVNEADFRVSAELRVFPNPACDQVSLQLPSEKEITSVSIYNQNGQLVRVVNHPYQSTLSIHDLTNGLYYLRAKSGNQTYLGKIIKQ